MSNILKKICDKKILELDLTKSKCSLKSLIKLLPKKNNRQFKKLLEESKLNQRNNIIAEIKKSSPSAGEIIHNYDPEDIAVSYEKSGAGGISILTESNFFKGNIDHISLVNLKTNIPLLRKDFILDEYQVYESKVFKADAILLIASILSDEKIKKFIDIAEDIGLDCIIETHTSDEINRALKIDYPIIGINNRNLDSLSIDIDNTTNLVKHIPKDFTVLGESGIKEYSDIYIYNKIGVYNFLIGEALLTAKDIRLKFNELLNK